jgi:hypothetical protein
MNATLYISLHVLSKNHSALDTVYEENTTWPMTGSISRGFLKKR